jgi:degradative hydroxymethylglutaryl-CoA reductase
LKEVVILSAVRTPIGKYRGALANFSAVRLGELVVQAAIERAGLAPKSVDQVIMGNVLQAGNGMNVARQIALNSGLAQSTTAMTVNEVCGSGMKALILAAQQIQLGEAEIVVAGGTESMSQAGRVQKYDYVKEEWLEPMNVMLQDGLTDAFSKQHMGLTAENVAATYQVDRLAQDRFAVASQQKAAAATAAGHFADEILPIQLADGTFMTQDESIRGNSSVEVLAKLKTVFKENGTVTAGNASTINDGASALVLTSKQYAIAHHLPYLAEFEGYSEVGIDPDYMGMAPVTAVQQLLAKKQTDLAAVDIFQINEAFASASIAVQDQLAIPAEKINIYGGAIALGHPIGATGARLVTTLLTELAATHSKRGVASLCIGGGLGLAVMVSRPEKGEPTGKKFYELTAEQRVATLVQDGVLTPEAKAVLQKQELPLDVTENLIENAISDYALPLGVVPHVVVNEQDYMVPFVTEEPSVVAAASNAAQLVRKAGGFKAEVLNDHMIGQIVFRKVGDTAKLKQLIQQQEAAIFAKAAASYPSIEKRGGGLRKMTIREFTTAQFVSVDLVIDTKEAMGANIVNTILEGVAGFLRATFPEEDILFSILSNLATESLVKASCDIPVAGLSKGALSGQVVAEKIAAASDFAQLDPYRATTHNKGIMNGIDAFILACGNDNRAVAAASHAYAAREGQYRGLATWTLSGEVLHGELTLPMALGTVGGATKVLPKAQLALALLKIKRASQLAELTVAIGLGQNLSALRALVTEGIQKGHMALQMRSLALSAGAVGPEVEQVVAELATRTKKDLQTTKAILKTLR